MSNAIWTEYLIGGFLLLSLGSWMHWLRTPATDGTRARWRHVAIGCLVFAAGFSVLLLLLWTRLNALHTVYRSDNPVGAIIIVAGFACFALWETVWTLLALRR